jgi:hypothetical protein
MTRRLSLIMLTLTLATTALADDESLRAAVGGGVGGAAGAYVGSELAGRNGAIVGGALGAATGAAVATEGSDADERSARHDTRGHHHPHGGHPGRFCPPGQAKKGRC